MSEGADSELKAKAEDPVIQIQQKSASEPQQLLDKSKST